MKWDACWRLMRLDKPVGTLLLWFPTAWALWLANKGMPSTKLVLLFFAGTLIMRTAGCVINDIADCNIDNQVERTQFRPLATGELNTRDALILLFPLLITALFILINLPWNCFYLGCISLLISFIYPFCKRFFSAPQFILGLAFSMGIPMAYVASNVPINIECILLFVLNFSWIVAYDTMYAMTDKEDDKRIGINSTALFFGKYDVLICGILLVCTHTIWLFLASCAHLQAGFYIVWALGLVVIVYQQKLLNTQIKSFGFKAFLMSSYYGALMWLALVFG